MPGAEDDAGPDAARGGSELGELGVAELDEEGEGAVRMVACERIEEAGIEFVVGALEGLGDGAQAVEGLFAVAFEQEEERVDASDEGVCARLGLVDNSEGPLEDGAGAVEVAAVEPGEPGQSICGGAEVAEAAGIEPLACERELRLCLLVSLQVDEDLCEGDACEVEVVEVANLGEGEARPERILERELVLEVAGLERCELEVAAGLCDAQACGAGGVDGAAVKVAGLVGAVACLSDECEAAECVACGEGLEERRGVAEDLRGLGESTCEEEGAGLLQACVAAERGVVEECIRDGERRLELAGVAVHAGAEELKANLIAGERGEVPQPLDVGLGAVGVEEESESAPERGGWERNALERARELKPALFCNEVGGDGILHGVA